MVRLLNISCVLANKCRGLLSVCVASCVSSAQSIGEIPTSPRPSSASRLNGLGEVAITPALHAGDFCSTQRVSPNPSGSVSLSEPPEIPAAKLGARLQAQNQDFITSATQATP